MNTLKLGIDIGSTTAKVVLLDVSGNIVYSDYRRHNTRILDTLLDLLDQICSKFRNISLQPAFSGSTAMGIAERIHIPFIQKIVAAANLVLKRYPGVESLIDIGGEDAKLALFNEMKNPDIRMNGNCAGGTGAYIDQMAALLNVSIAELNNLAWQSSRIYPIASRCGVFAKTDIQNLVSRKIHIADIAASIFEAVVGQVVNSLARGCFIKPGIFFCGGPLTYISFLRKSFSRLLKINREQIVVPEHAELFTALGKALSIPADQKSVQIDEFKSKIASLKRISSENNTLQPLFGNQEELVRWEKNRHYMVLPKKKLKQDDNCFLGIGGQDMKAIFVQNNTVSNIEINEACSSGCGSFIEGFANTLGYSLADFVALAMQSKAPYDLGSRCTVFMNSKVKQALWEGATISDLSTGLAYSVIKNCLNKVLRIKNMSGIGDCIVVHGGTFKIRQS